MYEGSMREFNLKQCLKRALPELLPILAFPAAFILTAVCRKNPGFTESVYSRRIYPAISFVLSKPFGVLPFSCAEILLYAVVLALLVALFRLPRFIKRHRGWSAVLLPSRAAGIIACAYLLFDLLWGLNYCRMPLARNLQYRDGTTSETALAAVMKRETDAVNSLCDKVKFSAGQSYYSGGFSGICRAVSRGYTALSGHDGTLFNANTPYPKGVLASGLMSYTGIEGIFIPFTYEPNIDFEYPQFVLPFTVAHECAHFKGFAKEEEANFVAYLADSANPDPYFRYSAHMMAYLYVSNALYATDRAEWAKQAVRLDRRAVGDFNAYNRFTSSHRSKASDLSNKVNDSYLKSQGQKGLVSYDLFVDLLAAQMRTSK